MTPVLCEHPVFKCVWLCVYIIHLYNYCHVQSLLLFLSIRVLYLNVCGCLYFQTRCMDEAESLDDEEARNMIRSLQAEMIGLRLKENETAILIKELRSKIKDLEDVIIYVFLVLL